MLCFYKLTSEHYNKKHLKFVILKEYIIKPNKSISKSYHSLVYDIFSIVLKTVGLLYMHECLLVWADKMILYEASKNRKIFLQPKVLSVISSSPMPNNSWAIDQIRLSM